MDPVIPQIVARGEKTRCPVSGRASHLLRAMDEDYHQGERLYLANEDL